MEDKKLDLTSNKQDLEKICEILNDPSGKKIFNELILNSNENIYLDILQDKNNLARYISNGIGIQYADNSFLSIGSAPFSKQGTFNISLQNMENQNWSIETWDTLQHVHTGISINSPELKKGKIRIYLWGQEKGDHTIM